MWFETEVLSHRCALSLFWMLLLQKATIDGFVFLIKVLSWHPIIGIQDWLYYLIDWKSVCYHLFLCATCIVFAILYIRSYEVKRHIYSTRFEILWTWVSTYRILHLAILSGLGCAITYCYLCLLHRAAVKGRHISYLSQRFVFEMWQDILFLIFHGFYAGALFCIRCFTREWNLLHFSLNETSKIYALRTKLKVVLNASVYYVIGVLHWYYLLYITCGFYICNWSSKIFGLEPSTSFSTWLYSLVSVNLLVTAFVTGTLLYFIWSLWIFVFGLYATERYEFIIDARLEENKNRALTTALAGTEFTLLRYLAFLDMRWLAQFSLDRRKKFFCISDPGGHPYQWMALANITIKLLDTFLENLKKLSVPKAIDGQMFDSKSNWENNTVFEENQTENLISVYREKMKSYFMKKPLMKYFFEEFPDVQALRLFTSCQLEIWTVEALGFFIAASYTEDKYGVVQQSLPQMLALLIDLKECEEKLPIGVMNFKKYAKDSKSFHTGVTQRHNLKAAIESSLYRIVLIFKTDIREVFLPEKYKRQLERYLEFKQ